MGRVAAAAFDRGFVCAPDSVRQTAARNGNPQPAEAKRRSHETALAASLARCARRRGKARSERATTQTDGRGDRGRQQPAQGRNKLSSSRSLSNLPPAPLAAASLRFVRRSERARSEKIGGPAQHTHTSADKSTHGRFASSRQQKTVFARSLAFRLLLSASRSYRFPRREIQEQAAGKSCTRGELKPRPSTIHRSKNTC